MRVHLHSDRTVGLFREDDGPEAAPPTMREDESDLSSFRSERSRRKKRRDWTLVCTSPCDIELPLQGNYRLDAEGLRATRTFRLAGLPGARVVVTLDPSTTSAFVTGIVVGGVGVAGVTVGVGALFVAFINSALGQRDNSEALNVSLGCTAGGAVVTIIGLSVILTNLHSSALVSRDRAGSAKEQSGPKSALDTVTRQPGWRDWREGAQLPAPPGTVTLRLWHTTF